MGSMRLINCDLCFPYRIFVNLLLQERRAEEESSLSVLNTDDVDRWKKSQKASGYSLINPGTPNITRESARKRNTPFSVSQFWRETGQDRRISRKTSSLGLLVGQGGGGSFDRGETAAKASTTCRVNII